MKTKIEKKFDSVAFFKAIKEKLALKMAGMTLEEQKVFMQKVRDGKIEIAYPFDRNKVSKSSYPKVAAVVI